MKSKKLLLIASIVCLMSTGCVYPARTVVVGPPPQAMAEVIPPSPGPDFYWVRGHWIYRYGRYDWVPGHYVRAYAGRAWVEGHYEVRGGTYVWVEGFWR
jgi:hypothetical protein